MKKKETGIKFMPVSYLTFNSSKKVAHVPTLTKSKTMLDDRGSTRMKVGLTSISQGHYM